MEDRTLLRVSLVSGGIAVLCCATPLLPIVLGTIGLSAWLVWADYLVISAVLLFLGLVAYVLVRRRGGSGCRVPQAPYNSDRR